MQEIKCCICGKRIPVVEGNNPYPVRKWSAFGSDKNRCCHSCNTDFVIPFRRVVNASPESEEQQIHERLMSYSHKELIAVKKFVFGKAVAQ